MKLKLTIIILLSLIFAILIIPLRSCYRNQYITDGATIDFYNISITYPKYWTIASDSNYMKIYNNDSSRIINIYTLPYSEGINEAYENINNLPFYIEKSKYVDDDKTYIDFTYTGDNYKTYVSKAIIFVYKDYIYNLQYSEEGTIIDNEDFVYELYDKLSYNDNYFITYTTEADTEPTTEALTEAQYDDYYVYIGKSGTKYHRNTCHTIKNYAEKISLKEALEQGRTPCGICKP